MWRNMVEPIGHRWQYSACALHAAYQRLQTHALTICNILCFSTATLVARTGLSVTLYHTYIACCLSLCTLLLLWHKAGF